MENGEAASPLPIDFADPIGILRRRWPWSVAVLVIGLIASFTVASLTTVTYLGSATLLINDQQIPEEYVRQITTEDPIQSVNAIVGEILSRDRIAALIERHGLYQDLRHKVEMIALVERARANVEVTPAPTVTSIGTRDSGSVIFVQFRDGNPEKAAAVANDLASLFIASASKMSGDTANLTTQFLKAEVERSERELRAQERLIADFKEKYRGELPSELGPNTSRLERLSLLRQTLSTELENAESRLADLEALGDLANPTSPHARLAALRAKLVSELEVNTEEHPAVIALRRQIEALQQDIASGRASADDPTQDVALREARQAVADLRRQIAVASGEAGTLEDRVARTAMREEELQALSQKAEVLQDTYVANLHKLKAAELSANVEAAQQGSRVEVLDRAVPPSRPERSGLKFLVAGLAATLLGAAGIALLFELIDPVVVSAQQLEAETGLRLLGSIGRIG